MKLLIPIFNHGLIMKRVAGTYITISTSDEPVQAFVPSSVDFFESSGDLPGFSGDAVIAVLRLLNGQAQYRRSDLGLIMQAVSVQALPIVSLICFWVGLILAFIGASQLQLFGAQIYVADLVGIAMVRLMAAIMTGIVMAGRTGGAFAAQLGTMQVNQEIAEGILQGVGKNWQSTAYH